MFTGRYDYRRRDDSRHPSNPVACAQMLWEITTLVGIYKIVKPRRVLEVGVQFGGTLRYWLINAQPEAIVVGIDHWSKKEMPRDPRPIWNSWVPEGVKFHPIIADSHDTRTKQKVLEIVNGIDFLFIDGDHTYNGVRQDFLLYGPLVEDGGIIAFHDLITPKTSPHIGVPILWREIQRAGYATRELFAKSEQDWGGIGVVYIGR